MQSLRIPALACMLALSMSAFAPATQATGVFGRNLIVNGSAEAGPGSANDSTVELIPGWTTTEGKLTAVQYGASGGFPDKNSPGAKGSGKNFFAGGPGSARSAATQTIDVAAGATAIDTGNVGFKLSAHIGGYSSQDDAATITAAFQDASGKQLGAATIGPVTAKDRKNQSGMLPRAAQGRVPIGTRTVLVTITATRVDGSYNDGECDDLSLVFTSPKPYR